MDKNLFSHETLEEDEGLVTTDDVLVTTDEVNFSCFDDGPH